MNFSAEYSQKADTENTTDRVPPPCRASATADGDPGPNPHQTILAKPSIVFDAISVATDATSHTGGYHNTISTRPARRSLFSSKRKKEYDGIVINIGENGLGEVYYLPTGSITPELY